MNYLSTAKLSYPAKQGELFFLHAGSQEKKFLYL
jgi:hypothetical protein